MVAIKLPLFSGMIPAIDDNLLAEQNAAYAQDTWLYSGALTGLPEKKLIRMLDNPEAAIAFRVPKDGSDPTYVYDGDWVEFINPHTNFISAPVSGDVFKRFYWTSPSSVPVYNTLQRMKDGLPPWLLGLPQPDAITVTQSGGSSTTMVSRAYLTTLVTEYGEEGPASAPVVINGKVDDTYAVTVAAVQPSDMGVNRNVKKIRIYRTITSAAGTATYYLLAELDASGSPQTYNDTMLDAVLASKPILESTAWTAPPNLDGFVTMPNGIVAGFLDNELWFSEPYRPHAWPAAYSLSLDYEIVGLAVVGQTLVICTTGNPYTASGVNPASITTSKLPAFEPCIERGSILPTEKGVFFASPNGIVLVNAGYAENITRQFITRNKWNEVVNRGAVNSANLGGAYYAFGAGVRRIAQNSAYQPDMMQQDENQGASTGFILDPQNPQVGFAFLEDVDPIKSVRNDAYSGEVFLVKSGGVYWIDQRPGFDIDDYVWVSKVFQTPDPRNFAAYKIYFDEPKNPSWPNPRDVSLDQVFDPETQLGLVKVYADGRLVSNQEFRYSGELHRLPSGFKAEFWQVRIEAKVKVKSFQMATSVKELSRV